MDKETKQDGAKGATPQFKLQVARDSMSLLLDCSLDEAQLPELSAAVCAQMKNLKIHLPPTPEEVEASLRQQAREHDTLAQFVLVAGTPVVPPEDAFIDWNGDYFSTGFVVDPETGNMNYRQRIARTTVAKEELLATLVPGVEGKAGRDVFGKAIRPPKIRVPRIKAGVNVRHEPDTDQFFAGCEGRIRWQYGVLAVDNVYTVRDSVGLKTGNITHPGALIIEKDVTAGAHVQADGDIEIFGVVEPSTIESGGNVTVHGGITGGPGHSVKLRGVLKAKYILEAHVQASGGILVEKEIVHSEIHTRGPVDVAGGRIVGGSVSALGGITVGKAGSDAGIPTTLITGTDQIYENRIKERYVELAALEERAEKIHKTLDALIPRMQVLDEAKQEKLQALVTAMRTMEERITTLQGYIEDHKAKFEAKAHHEIHIRNILYAECFLIIRNQRYKMSTTVPGPLTAYSANHKFKLRTG